MYFRHFPRFNYEFTDLDGNRRFIRIVDILRNVRFRQVLEDITIWDFYNLRDGETLDVVAEKIYGTPQYHWILAISNNIFNFRTDMPMSAKILQKYIDGKYPGTADDIRFHEKDGIVVSSATPGATPVTNRGWEERENESRRRIRVPHPDVIARIARDFSSLI